MRRFRCLIRNYRDVCRPLRMIGKLFRNGFGRTWKDARPLGTGLLGETASRQAEVGAARFQRALTSICSTGGSGRQELATFWLARTRLKERSASRKAV